MAKQPPTPEQATAHDLIHATLGPKESAKFRRQNNLTDPYTPPKGHDKHLSDTERAHSGKEGSKVRHGADATGQTPRGRQLSDQFRDDVMKNSTGNSKGDKLARSFFKDWK